MRKLPPVTGLSIVLAVALLTVSCTKIDYVGRSYAPTSEVDIYLSFDDIKGSYEVMGLLTASAGAFVSTEKMQEKILEKAREKGADAVVILGLDRRVVEEGTSWKETTETKETEKGTKTTTAGSAASNTEEIKEITARFIKYTDPGE